MTVKARAYRNGSDPSDITTANYTLQVLTPNPSPKPGQYTTAPTVTLATTPGATIHYTVNGAAPTAASPVYAAPIVLSGAATIRAVAYKAGWTDSPVLTAHYTLGTDTTDPTITTQVEPAPNQAGWNNTPVTVTFICSDDFADPLDCPAPVTLSSAGTNQIVNGTAEDGTGHTASTSVTVNIDLTPPEVTLSSPSGPTSTSAASIGITGTASDSLSGLDQILCAGEEVTAGPGGAVSCTVTLIKGLNTLIVNVVDVAGNSTSATVDVTRTGAATSLSFQPAMLTLAVGQQTSLHVQDDFGVTPVSITFTSSDNDVAEMSTDVNGLVIAKAAGTVTITATAGALTAEAEVNVVAGTLTAGTVLWVAPGGLVNPLAYTYARRVDAFGPDMYLLDHTEGHVLIGLKSDGHIVSRQALQIGGGDETVSIIMADSFGGVLLGIGPECSEDRGCQSIVRAGYGTPGTWQYRSSSIATSLTSLVQTDSGDIYGVEGTESDGISIPSGYWRRSTGAIVRINGSTGNLASRVPLPQSHGTSLSCEWNDISDFPASVGNLVVGPNDHLYGLVFQSYSRSDYATCNDERYNWQYSHSLQLVHGSPTGGITLSTLESFSTSATWGQYVHVPLLPNMLTPDPRGGLLLWSIVDGNDDQQPTMRYISAGGTMSDLPFKSSTAPLVGRQGMAYIQAYMTDQWLAFDTVTQQQVGTLPNLGTPIAVTAGNEVAFFDRASVTTLATSGAVTGGGPLAWNDDITYWTNSGYHITSGGGLVGAVVGPELWDETFFQGVGGNRQGQGQGRKPTMATFRVVDQVSLPGASLTAAEAKLEFDRDVPNLRTTKREYHVANATIFNFFDEVRHDWMLHGGGQPVDAVGVIAHAVGQNPEPGDPNPNEMKFSVGIQFHDLDLIKLRNPPLGPQWYGQRGPSFAHRVAKLKSQVGIVFVGSCYVGDDFESLFQYTPNGHQALIAPRYQGLTDLKAATNAWREIAKRLSACETVDDAVDYWNNLPETTQPFEYRVVGNGGKKLAICPAP